jgi:RNA polymerase sigma factor (TIGR02999 family)
MSPEPVQPVTELLRAAQRGDAAAAERLMAVVYEHLHRLARARMARLPPGLTLQPTALVHEAYLRLTDKTDVTWESRQHFFFAAARGMRDILVEQARRKTGPVRGGGRRRQERHAGRFQRIPGELLDEKKRSTHGRNREVGAHPVRRCPARCSGNPSIG